MVPTPPPSSPAPDLDRVWGVGERQEGEGKGKWQSGGGKGGENGRERERLVGSEKDRIHVLSHAVVQIEQGKSILWFKEIKSVG